MKLISIYGLIFTFIFLYMSCSEYQKLLNSDDTSKKYKQAEIYYNSGEYRQANRLFEQIIPKYRGRPQAQRIIFFFAETYMQTKRYSLAAYQYENFIKSYPKSERIQEASFKAAKSYYFQSPTYSLDQKDTHTAIEKLQVFINLYPNSEYTSEANQMISELQEKLEKKDFEIARQYYTIRDYSSAMKSLDNFIADNPGTIFREEALYYRWLSQYEIAINSIESRINERVAELERSLDNFLRYYPDTIFIDDLSEKINNAKQLL